MASKYCLPKNLSLEFRRRLKNDEINPERLALMTSLERHDFFKSFLGEENAKNVNSLFESKLLLKSKQQGMITWAKTVTGIKPQVRANLIEKIGKMDKILNPAEEKAFLQDLASTKVGTNVTLDEAKQLTELSSKVQQAKTDLQTDITNKAKQIEYGSRIYDLQQYLDQINPNKRNVVANVIGVPRTLVASLDFVSAPFRHGYFAMSDKAWIKNIVRMPQLFLSEKAFRARMGEIYGHPYYDSLVKGGLRIFKTGGDISKQEEQFASNILNKFPLTAASKRGYTGFLNGLRMDMGVALLKSAELRGDDIGIGSKLVKDFATMINNLTGAGSLGRFETAAPTINMGIFSSRKLVATFNTFNPVTYINPKTSGRARLFALKNLIGSLAISFVLLKLADKAGIKVNVTDPTKTDFGEISIGNLRIDVTGGNRTYMVLLARLISGQYTSGTSGKVTQLNQGAYKPTTRGDLLISYLLGKLAPGAASTLSDFLFQQNGKDAFGNDVTIANELKKNLIPLNITNGMDIFNADPNNTALGIVLGLFGLPVNTAVNSNSQTNFIPTGKAIKNADFIDQVATYAQALGTDPETAFNRIFSGQTIKRVTNGTVIVQRMSLQDSTAVKKAGHGNNPSMKLDHTVPLEIGGSNDTSNLKLVTTSTWSSYTPVENALGKALTAGKISKADAQAQITKFKSISNSSARKAYGQTIINKYK